MGPYGGLMQLYICSVSNTLPCNTHLADAMRRSIGGELMAVWGYVRSDNAGPMISLVVYSRSDLGDVVGMIGAEVLAKTLSDTGVIEELLLLREEAGLFDWMDQLYWEGHDLLLSDEEVDITRIEIINGGDGVGV